MSKPCSFSRLLGNKQKVQAAHVQGQDCGLAGHYGVSFKALSFDCKSQTPLDKMPSSQAETYICVLCSVWFGPVCVDTWALLLDLYRVIRTIEYAVLVQGCEILCEPSA